MRANSLMIAMMVLSSATLFGQNDESDKKITGGVARKLSEILVGVGDDSLHAVKQAVFVVLPLRVDWLL